MSPEERVLRRVTEPDAWHPAPSTPEPSGPCHCTPDQFQGSGHGVNCPQYRAAPSTEPALDVILGALRDGANDCPAYLDTDDARAGWSAAFARAEWLVEDVFDARLAESES